MHPHPYEAIVLRTTEYRENDLIVVLFSLEHGRFSGIARGARRSRKRFGAALDLFAHIRLHAVVKEGLATLSDADIITIHDGIRNDLAKIACAGYACELLERLLPEGLTNPRGFRLLSTLLDHLDSNPASDSIRRFYEANLLKILGYAHSFDRCERCGTELSPTMTLSWHPGEYALLCAACGTPSRRISPETAELLRKAHATGRFGAIIFPPPLLNEAGALLDSAITALIGRPLRSRAFLEEIGPLEAQ
jgi:DNA repair protein RecO (recombination protein O)